MQFAIIPTDIKSHFDTLSFTLNVAQKWDHLLSRKLLIHKMETVQDEDMVTAENE